MPRAHVNYVMTADHSRYNNIHGVNEMYIVFLCFSCTLIYQLGNFEILKMTMWFLIRLIPVHSVLTLDSTVNERVPVKDTRNSRQIHGPSGQRKL